MSAFATPASPRDNLPKRRRFLAGVLLLALALAASFLWAASVSASREPGADKTEAAREVKAVLEKQDTAWNKGDLDGFMDTYWDSDKLTFYSGGTVTKGRKALAERYKKRYKSGGKSMGKLTFSDMEVTALGADSAFARGHWKVVMGKETFEGLFTLLLRKFADGWKIVHDHTSQADPPKPG